MGNSASVNLQTAAEPERSELLGFRVLTISKDSPAAHCGLEVFFDFILSVDDRPIADMDAFFDVIARSESKRIYFTVLSLRTASQRRVACIPQRWSGPGLLGATVGQERVVDAYSEGLRVVQVMKASPADEAGLHPKTDYLVACSRGIFRDISDFEAAMSAASSMSSEILVFSSIDRSLRTVRLPVARPEDERTESVGLSLGQGALDSLPLEKFPVSGSSGLQILRIDANGPLAIDGGLELANWVEPIFTFITLVNGKTLTSREEFRNLLEISESIRLTLWNTRRERSTEISVHPRTNWGDGNAGKLGATVKYYDDMDEVGKYPPGLHVLEILEGSPAHLAGIRAGFDYLLASDSVILYSLQDLETALVTPTREDGVVTLTVFDASTCRQREVQLKPDHHWGGPGCLGCDLGAGAMHRPPTD